MEGWRDGVMEWWSIGVALIVGLEFTCRVMTSAFPSSLPGFLLGRGGIRTRSLVKDRRLHTESWPDRSRSDMAPAIA